MKIKFHKGGLSSDMTAVINGFKNPWSPPSRAWDGASEGERQGREGLALRNPRPR